MRSAALPPGDRTKPDLRAAFIAHFSPWVRDVVIAGEGRSQLAALVFPAEGFSREKFDSLLKTFAGTGSSNRIERTLVLEEPPLARALHASVPIGQYIPANLFNAVAEVLAVRGIPFVFATGYASLSLRKPFARAARPAKALSVTRPAKRNRRSAR